MTIDRNIRERFRDQQEETLSPSNLGYAEAEDGIASELNPEDVATLAYTYWHQRGCPDGCPDEDWYRAEKEIASQNGRG